MSLCRSNRKKAWDQSTGNSQRKPQIVTAIEKPRTAFAGCPGPGSGLEEENKNRMRLLQQVMCQRHIPSYLSLRTLNQELRIKQEARDPIVVQISLPGCDRTDNVRSKRLTFHSTAELDSPLASYLHSRRLVLSIRAGKQDKCRPASPSDENCSGTRREENEFMKTAVVRQRGQRQWG